MTQWDALAQHLGSAPDVVTLTWPELTALVGPLPSSATNHRAWWSGERSHVAAWRTAGFDLAQLEPGVRVTFRRRRQDGADPRASSVVAPRLASSEDAGSPPPPGDILLISCVKSKGPRPDRARDLYRGSLFTRLRSYAEASGRRWFILSAEHGLVAPDEWLAPYERYLPETPSTYRGAWGRWVVARLELLCGDLKNLVVEVHAGSAYVEPLRQPLAERGAVLSEPLHGLSMGQRLAAYADPMTTSGTDPAAGVPSAPHVGADDNSAQDYALRLSDEARSVAPRELMASESAPWRRPGLYSWWVDEVGAADLSRGLGRDLAPGLVYAGLAGATRWPSGRRSANTLWSRLVGMHLGGRHEFSTFRRTLGAILANIDGSQSVDEDRLSAWMADHLKVVPVPHDDADSLGTLERGVLARLDPPLNLQGMPPTDVRRRVRELRRLVTPRTSVPPRRNH